MAMPYEEVVGGACSRITVKPKTDSTNTEAVWKARAKEGGWFVKRDTTSLNSAGHGYIEVTFLADNDATILGRLEEVKGSGDDLVAAVELVGVDGNALGNGTGALAVADFGDGVQGASDGKLKIVATGGYGAVYGGDKANLRLSWNSLGTL